MSDLRRRCFLLALLLMLSSWPFAALLKADEIRPALLQLEEVAANQFAVLWKRPLQQGQVVALQPIFPDHCQPAGAGSPRQRSTDLALLQFWTLDCGLEGLAGYSLRIEGLGELSADAMVRLTLLDDSRHQSILSGTRQQFSIPTQPDASQVAIDYLRFGVEHILGGVDHLLFVLGLLFLCGSLWTTAKTITGFTLAHSITLVAASMSWLSVPQQPVEVLIALSIVFLAVEIIRKWRGQWGLAARKPWLVSFIFGLLHGLGFAGALAEVGLPQQELPLALAMFNIGVELGQLAFVLVVIASQWLLAKIISRYVTEGMVIVERTVVWSVGLMASFWFWQRLALLY